MRQIDDYFLAMDEPFKGCNLALRHIILNQHKDITEAWKYKLPFFLYNGKPLCYLWMDKQSKNPYIGFVKGAHLDHPDLDQGDRKKMKVLHIDPTKDIPKALIEDLLKASFRFF